ncbi:MAG: transcriptional regulator [Candidatus Dactylopiibacterium carminicum]|nr:MAG: transcriptional regulator [Candidatus Dactylopiibacterium carminicum]
MKRAEDLELSLGERPPGLTLQRWLYGELRAAILSGRIAPGKRLPSTRDLARQQGLSRSTVLAAYDQLIAEGYLASLSGSGTVVHASLPTATAATKTAPKGGAAPQHVPPLSREGERLARSPFPTDEFLAPSRPFRPNQPDLKAFPFSTWNRLLHRHSRTTPVEALGYGDAAGHLPLRQAIAEHLRYSQRITCDPRQVMILSSAQQALDLCARLLLDEGDEALVEDPGYPGAAHLFSLTGAIVRSVPVDPLGLCTAPALPASPRTRLAYVTAAHQSPLGGALPIERRLALLAWAEACNATIIEDDYDGEYRFDGIPLSALKSLDRNDRVIYLGTFSKLLFPALRLAYVVLPDWLVSPFASALSLTCRHTPVLQQAVLAAFIAEGHFARHLRHMRMLYGERAAIFQETCRAELDGLLTVMPITTGLDAMAILPAFADDDAIASALLEAGIETRPVSFYRLTEAAPPGLVMGFSAFTEAQLRAGVAAMTPILERCLRR